MAEQHHLCLLVAEDYVPGLDKKTTTAAEQMRVIKRYFAFEASQFQRLVQAEKAPQCCYEIIPGSTKGCLNRGARLYLDAERDYTKEDPAPPDPELVRQALEECLYAFLEQTFPLVWAEYRDRLECRWLTSHKYSADQPPRLLKLSFHMILAGPLFFTSNDIQMKAFVNEFIHVLLLGEGAVFQKHHALLTFWKDDLLQTFLDCMVYTPNRCFRMLGSCKFPPGTKPRILQPIPSQQHLTLRDCLVTPQPDEPPPVYFPLLSAEKILQYTNIGVLRQNNFQYWSRHAQLTHSSTDAVLAQTLMSQYTHPVHDMTALGRNLRLKRASLPPENLAAFNLEGAHRDISITDINLHEGEILRIIGHYQSDIEPYLCFSDTKNTGTFCSRLGRSNYNQACLFGRFHQSNGIYCLVNENGLIILRCYSKNCMKDSMVAGRITGLGRYPGLDYE